mmetsp:Transcript_15441/g.27442  ORF Transcript_15441/g.27442 Transcript_15441/m.27442 type:complete len:272 (+) Transcript_15441:2031-2846(+)
MKIEGEVCWVSGAAQGIGHHVCSMLVERGGKVVMVDICDEARGEKIAADLSAAGPGKAAFVRADLTDLKALEEALKKPKEIFGQVASIVCGNAGLAVEDDDPRLVAMLQLNAVTVIVGTKIAADLMKEANVPGVVINTASMAGLTPTELTPAYAGSKFAVAGHTMSSRLLKKSHNVRVNCICPTLVTTPTMGKFFHDQFKSQKGIFAKVADNMLVTQRVADAFIYAIEDDNLVATAIGILPEKTFLHNPKFGGVLKQERDPKVPHYTGAKL